VSALALLAEVVTALDAAGIPHMLTGSYASSFHGEPRATNDVDLVIDPSPAALAEATARLRQRSFYVGDEAAALSHRSMFNVIDTESGSKVDLIIRKDRAFSVSEFERRRVATVDGMAIHITSVEDLILAKLEWARIGGSERQRRDIEGILAVSGGSVDRAYLEHWAEELGLGEELSSVLDLDHG
jgi:hypothetical protein